MRESQEIQMEIDKERSMFLRLSDAPRKKTVVCFTKQSIDTPDGFEEDVKNGMKSIELRKKYQLKEQTFYRMFHEVKEKLKATSYEEEI